MGGGLQEGIVWACGMLWGWLEVELGSWHEIIASSGKITDVSGYSILLGLEAGVLLSRREKFWYFSVDTFSGF